MSRTNNEPQQIAEYEVTAATAPNWAITLSKHVQKRGVVTTTLVFTLIAIAMSTAFGEATFYLIGGEIDLVFHLLPILTPAVVAPGLFYFLFSVLLHLEKTLAELEQKSREAEQANSSKSAFLMNMSHELRTPLNAIIGFSDALKSGIYGSVSDIQKERIEDIVAAGSHLLSLIDEVLDFSKIEAGIYSSSFEEVDVQHEIESAIAFVSGPAEIANVRISTEIPLDIPPLHADQRLIRQMVINLLTNAVKFTPEKGQVVISVSDHNDAGLHILVKDTGVGIDEIDIPKALEIFGQIDSSMSRQHDGLGLGLPLVQSFMKLHGGTLEIESEPKIGTVVRLVFPANANNHIL